MATIGRRLALRPVPFFHPSQSSFGIQTQCRRPLQTSTSNKETVTDFAFAFDIDGVLLRSSTPLPGASKSLNYLQRNKIPFILLTNGGGKFEEERVEELSSHLENKLDASMFIQSHTPFAELVNGNGKDQYPLRDKCILVTGGDGDKCRRVAEKYGFTNVITPGDLITTFPTLSPFTSRTDHESHARSLQGFTLSPRHYHPQAQEHTKKIKVDAIFVFSDPRDWALDTQIILDLLLSQGGYLGSLSRKNGNPTLSNKGYLQDGQPPLYFSNPDLFWAAEYHLPRLGQGGFREAFEGVWNAVTGGQEMGVNLDKRMFGKPHQGTYEFAEKRLQTHRNKTLGLREGRKGTAGLKQVYMVGDNPESDILGANSYTSPIGTKWQSILVRSGVYTEGEPAHKPTTIVKDVWEAVSWGLKSSGWPQQ